MALVDKDVNMKIFLTIVFLFSTSVNAQVFDTAYIAPRNVVATKGNKVAAISLPRSGNETISVQYFDGTKWSNISKNNEPTLHDRSSHCTFSKFSDKLYITGLHHLWEYNGNEWTKYSKNDSFDNKRTFDDIIELSDSSLLITAYTKFSKGQVTQAFSIDSMFHELLQFKNGEFITIKSQWTNRRNDNRKVFFGLKFHKNNTYSLSFTNFNSKNNLNIPKEIVTYSLDEQIQRKDTFPDLKPYGFTDTGIVFNDYLFDSKGSLWYLTESPQRVYVDPVTNKVVFVTEFVGLVEITLDGTINLYNENIGIGNSSYESQSFTIDENDNIWFFYNYRPGNVLPSLYKLDSTRKILTEYRYETYLKYSDIYSGGNTVTFGGIIYGNILFNDFTNSLFVTRNGTNMLQFFLDRIPTSVYNRNLIPCQVFPNPIQNGNNIHIYDVNIQDKKQSTIILHDIGGNLVKAEDVISCENKVSLSSQGLAKGSYFVSIIQDNIVILQTKVIKE